jgi:hypothetical protein
MDAGFQVAVKILVGVSLRRIGWKKEHLDLLLVFLEPCRDHFGVVHPEIIENEKHCSPREGNFQAGMVVI